MLLFLLTITQFYNCLSKQKPNIIYILSDDLGYDDLFFQSHQINTPNIDFFKNNGQFMEWHYAQCVCSPSRAAIHTGRYPLHTGINDWIQPTQSFGVPLNNTMLPEILLQNGYDTHAVGKWHLGFFKWDYTPTFRGYKSFYGYYTGGEDYFKHTNKNYYDFRDDIGVKCGNDCSRVASEAYEQYSANLFSERAIEIIKNHTNNENTKDTPLFLYLAYQSVHSPAEVPEEYTKPYDGIINDAKRKTFAGMVSCMDQGIGNITNVLRDYGYLNNDGNTIVIFSADNGGPTTTGDGVGSSNYPLRGGKHSIYEGGTRVTSFIYATPDIISNELPTIGKNYTQLTHLVDWLPTILEAANITHTFEPGLELDGVSQWKGLLNGNNFKDKYFNFRQDIYYGLDDDPMINIGYRYKWNKIFNISGGEPNTWSPNDNSSKISLLNNCINYSEECYTTNLHEILTLNELLLNGFGNITNITGIPLYNLSNDYAEKHDISKNNQNIVSDLVDKLNVILSTGIPQAQNDPNCGPITHPNNSVVGPVWAPWC